MKSYFHGPNLYLSKRVNTWLINSALISITISKKIVSGSLILRSIYANPHCYPFSIRLSNAILNVTLIFPALLWCPGDSSIVLCMTANLIFMLVLPEKFPLSQFYAGFILFSHGYHLRSISSFSGTTNLETFRSFALICWVFKKFPIHKFSCITSRSSRILWKTFCLCFSSVSGFYCCQFCPLSLVYFLFHSLF